MLKISDFINDDRGLEYWVEVRPDFGSHQIRTTDGLEVGTRLVINGPLYDRAIVTVTRSPYIEMAPDMLAIEVRFDDPEQNLSRIVSVVEGKLSVADNSLGRIFLSSYGVIPMSPRRKLWRKDSWLEWVE